MEGAAQLRIFSSTGELVKNVDQRFNRGVNVISIDKDDIPQSGMYTYELIYKDQLISKRMIILN